MNAGKFIEARLAEVERAARGAAAMFRPIGEHKNVHGNWVPIGPVGSSDRDQVEREFAQTACLKAWADCSHPPPGSVGCATAELDCVAYTRAIDPEIVAASAAGPACVPQLAVAPRPGTPKAVLAEALAKVSRDLAVARAQLAALGR